ncbi:MAG: rhomboid family intramembrane serine protease [Planctomycetota bacterium]
MSFENREYYRQQPSGFGRNWNTKSVTTWLIIINAVVFLWDGVFAGSHRGSALALEPYAWFSVEQGVERFQIWRFLSFQFVHGDLFHIAFNMLGLYFFGPMIERWWGSRRFLAFYLLCGVSGAVLASILAYTVGPTIMPVEAPVPVELPDGRVIYDGGAALVGASGGLFGILAACAVLFPDRRVMLLIPPVPMTMRTMAIIFLTLALLSVMAGSRNAGGEAAHLGGAVLGFFLVRKPGLLKWADGLSVPDVKGAIQEKQQQRASMREQLHEKEVDRILAKVKNEGLASLSEAEKRVLNADTQRKRQER